MNDDGGGLATVAGWCAFRSALDTEGKHVEALCPAMQRAVKLADTRQTMRVKTTQAP